MIRICVLYYLDITSILHHIIYPVIIIYYSLILMHLTGPVALCSDKVVKADGTPLVAGIDFTCFTDSEEAAVGATESIPFSMQQKLTELGGKFSGGADWGPTVCTAGKVVTGQNPASSAACAEAVIALL